MTVQQTDSSTPLSDDPSASGISLPISSGSLAVLLDGRLDGSADVPLDSLGSVADGSQGSLTFIRSSSYAKLWADSRCGCALVSEGLRVPGHDAQARALIFVPDADEAMVALLEAINPGRVRPRVGVHQTAIVDPASSVDGSVSIGAGCVVGAGTKVCSGAVLMPNVTVGAGVRIGDCTVLEPGVVVEDRCVIGERCQIGSNSVIGSDGFGYLPPTDARAAMKVPQIGNVLIGDDVELGACVTIDRAKFGSTTIGQRTKIDNQVHVAHNCIIGTDALICGRTTLGGSVYVGNHAMIGGAVVLNDHAKVGDNARIAGGTIVLECVPDGEAYAGIPAMPARTALLNYSSFRELSSFVRKVEKRLKKLEADDGS